MTRYGLRILTLAMAALILCFLAPPGAPQSINRDLVARDAEYALRDAIGHWAAGRDWTLWEMGTEDSRIAVSREALSERMRKSTVRPTVGALQALRVDVRSATQVLIYCRLQIESRHASAPQTLTPVFALQLEDDRWRVSLEHFYGMMY